MDELLELHKNAWRAVRAAANSGAAPETIVDSVLAIVRATDDVAALRETASKANERITELAARYRSKDASFDRRLEEKFPVKP